MLFQKFFVVAITTASISINTVVTSASDWAPTGSPEQLAFQPLRKRDASPPVDADFKPPLVVPDNSKNPPLVPPASVEPGDTPQPVVEPEAPKSEIHDPNVELPEFDDGPPSGDSGNSEPSEFTDHPVIEEPGEKPDAVLPEVQEDEGLRELWNESSIDWVLGSGSDGIGFFSLTGDAPSWEFDLSSDDTGLDIDFGSAIHFVSGPSRSDLPPRLFDLFWNTKFRTEITDGFGIDANFQLGLFTDFEDSVRKGWRFPGRALGYMDIVHDHRQSTARLVAGIEYLDLEQTEILPAGGLIIEPNADTRLNLYFPRPQVRFRINEDESEERWLYLRGEYHGSAWAIERTTGNADVVALTEYRATIGLETIPCDQEESASFIEVGYIFNRDLEYRSQVGNFQPEDTFVFRIGSRF